MMKSVLNDEMTFYNVALEAIADEEILLNNLFETNHKYYPKQHYGVCNLYETTYVYLIFKALLQYGFEHTVFWEFPYPNNSKLHADMALLDENGELEALIEFKLWLKDDDKAIQSDIEKLKRVEGCSRYIFVVGYGGNLEENAEYLSRESGVLREVNKKSLKTRFYSSKENSMIKTNLNVFMYEVL